MSVNHTDLERGVQMDRDEHSAARTRLRQNLLELERALREAKANEAQMGDEGEARPHADAGWRWPWQR